jgi:hypothetical protein
MQKSSAPFRSEFQKPAILTRNGPKTGQRQAIRGLPYPGTTGGNPRIIN